MQHTVEEEEMPHPEEMRDQLCREKRLEWPGLFRRVENAGSDETIADGSKIARLVFPQFSIPFFMKYVKS